MLLILFVSLSILQEAYIDTIVASTANDTATEIAYVSSKSGSWIQAKDGRWWYRHDDGSYTTNGWEQIKGQWYYFDSEGWMVTGALSLNGTAFKFNSNGELYYTKLSVPRIRQAKSNWCWVASSLMVGKYINPSSRKTQATIVSHVKGSVVDNPGTDYEIESAIEYVCNADAIANYKTLSAYGCENKLMYYKPLVIHMSWFGGNTGHSITCYGYDRDHNHTFFFHDPSISLIK